MKVIIDIPDEVWNIAKEYGHLDICGIELSERVMNGIPYEERPQGKWIITGEEQGAFGMFYKIRKCDKCGFEHSLCIPKNFCPSCGALMNGGAE